ncbi:hypothetical protein [Natronomonas sp. LN261]|jgi:hypothetical protein|nr:hypothetical protein [Natronomonas sp. LN261]
MRDEIEPMVPTMPRSADPTPSPRPDGGRTTRFSADAVDAPFVPDLR